MAKKYTPQILKYQRLYKDCNSGEQISVRYYTVTPKE